MKKIITLAALASVFAICVNAQKVAYNAKPGEVIIKGKIGTLSTPAEIWLYMGDEKWDSVPLKNGVFNYRKKTLLPAYGAILLRYTPYDPQKGSLFDKATFVSVFFEDGTMHVKSPVDSLRNHAVITGSVIHDQHAKFWKKEGDIVRQQKAIAAEFNSATPEQLQSAEYIAAYELKTKVLAKRRDSLVAAQIKKYPNSLVSSMAFYSFLRQEPDSAAAASMLNLFSKEYLQSKPGEMMVSAVKELGKAAEPVITINAGEQAPDFEQNDTTGTPMRLSSLKGKYVLIDFWASWCVPCRKVNPDLVKMYEKYRGDKFAIIGVSLDENKEKWIEAIHKDKLAWHHVSDLKGWQNDVAKRYGIEGIPQNLLLDPNGKVLFKNLSIEAIESELKKLVHN